MAALASDAATQDPIDLAVLQAAQEKKVLNTVPRRIQFIRFDPAINRSEAFYEKPQGKLRVVKGAPDALISLVGDTRRPDGCLFLASRGFLAFLGIGFPDSN